MTRRFRLALFTLPFLLPLALLVAGTILVSSTTTSQWIARQIEQRIPAIKISKVDGTLRDGVNMGQLQIGIGTTSVVLDNVSVALRWRCLLWASLCIESLHVENLTIATHGSDSSNAAPSRPLPSLHLPLRLRWYQLAVDRMTLGSGDNAQYFNAIKSSGIWTGNKLVADYLQGQYLPEQHQQQQYLQMAIDISGNIIFSGGYPIDISLRFADEHRGIQLSADVGGDVAMLNARLQIEQPVRAQGTLALEPLDPLLAYRARLSLLTPYKWRESSTQSITVADGAFIELHGNKESLDGDLQLQALLPRLQQPVELKAPFRFDIAQSQLVATPQLQAGKTAINGELTLLFDSVSTLALKAQGNNIDPAIWIDGYSGSLNADIDIKLEWDDQLHSVIINRFVTQGHIKQQTLEARIAGNWHRQAGWKIPRGDLHYGKNMLQLSASGDARTAKLDIDAVTADAGDLKLGCTISGLFETKISSRCAQLTWQAPAAWQMPRWQIQRPLLLQWEPATALALLAPFCLQANAASICSNQQTRWHNGDIDAALVASHINMSWASHWLPPGYGLNGTLSGRLALQRKAGALARWSATASSDNVAFRFDTGKHRLTIPMQKLHGEINNNEMQLQASLTLNAGNFGNANVQLALTPDQKLAGSATLTDSELKALQPLLPNATVNAGTLRADVRIGGTRVQPLVNGSMQIERGEIKTAQLPWPIADINARLGLEHTHASLQATAAINKQPVNASGELDWRDTVHGKVRLVAHELHLSPLPRTDIWISPELEATLHEGAVAITGRVDVPRAYVIIKELPKNGVTLSKDVSIESDDIPAEQTMPITGHVDVVLGDAVSFRGFGLQTRLSGKLGIKLADNQLRGAGHIQLLDGRYRAYGQMLDIRSGDLVFVGPLDNPMIRIDAIRPDVPSPNVVGLRAEGELRKPNIVLFSTPAMSERARMQYLLTGRAPDSDEESSGSILGQALLAYGAGESEGIVAGVANKFGVHDVSISTAEGETGPQVQLSAYLNSRLFLRYGKNVFDNANEITMRYQLTKNLFVEAVSGVASALDLLWSFEFGSADKE